MPKVTFLTVKEVYYGLLLEPWKLCYSVPNIISKI